MTNALAKKLLKNTKYCSTILEESTLFTDGFVSPTKIPMLNVALSGKIDGGLTAGVTVIAGESKSFKTMFGLLIASAYMKNNPDSIMLFYDSEFGSPPDYFETFGIDTSRVVHTPIMNVEQLKFDLVSQLENIERKDNVFVFVDSIGNLASKKEVEDAKDSKSALDMSRAKQIKSFFRIVTPYFQLNDIPGLFINHTYQTQEMFSKTIVSGGTGVTLSSNTVWVVNKSQEKDSKKNLEGWNFNVNINKSRYVQEKKKIPIQVFYKTGINTFSGLLQIGEELGYIEKVGKGRYSRNMVDKETGEVIPDEKSFTKKQTDNAEFWSKLFANSDFKKAIEAHYSIGKLSEDEMVKNESVE